MTRRVHRRRLGATAGASAGHGHGGGGEMRWLLTYSDLITLLMVFFVVLYSIANVDAQKYQGLAQAMRTTLGVPRSAAANVGVVAATPTPTFDLTEPAGPPVPPQPEPATAPQPVPPAQHDPPEPPPKPPKPPPDPLAAVRTALAGQPSLAGTAEIRLSEEGLVVSILGSVLFESGQANLRPGAGAVLSALSGQLKDLPNQVVVQGSTDNTPISTPLYPSNWELSSARASAVVRFFTAGGLAAGRFVAVGLADTRPAFDNRTESGRSANQRVDVIILRKPLSLLPTP